MSILVFVLAHSPRQTPALTTQATDALAGATAGVLAVTTGTSGPPLLIAVSQHQLSPAQERATLAWLSTVFGLTTIAWLQLTGHMPTQSRGLLLTSMPPLAAGTFLGSLLGRHLPSRAITIATRLLLLGSALACLTQAATR